VNRLANLVHSRLSTGADELIEEIFKSVAEFRGLITQFDDITVSVLRVTSAAGSAVVCSDCTSRCNVRC